MIASNPAMNNVKVPASGAGVTEEGERSFDTVKPFPRPQEFSAAVPFL
jgi:hypothetical protein